MSKIFLGILGAVLIPLFIFGMVRIANGYADFLPPADEIVAKFASMPNFSVRINSAVVIAMSWTSDFTDSFKNMTDIMTWVMLVPNFLKMIGGFCWVALNWLYVPIEFLGWLFNSFLRYEVPVGA